MPLNLTDKNKKYTILRIAGNEREARRLESLGFVPGSEITILSVIDGNFLVSVKGTRIGIGCEYAKRILVI